MKKLAIFLAFCSAVTLSATLARPALAQQAALRTSEAYTQGLLWKIEAPGVAPSYLFGTIHISDPRVIALPVSVKQSFDGASSFAMEIKFDPANVLQLANRMIYTDGRGLASVAGSPLFEKVSAIAPSLGLPPEVLRHFKPWAIALLLMMPPSDVENVLDNRLYQMAMQQNKDVRQLETVDEQVEALEHLSEPEQVALLRSAVANRERLAASVERMIGAYLKRDLAELLKISEQDAVNDAAAKRLNATLMQRLLDDRNVRMAERMEPQLKSGRAFVAIGALHLYGERGVLARVANRGYRVTRVY